MENTPVPTPGDPNSKNQAARAGTTDPKSPSRYSQHSHRLLFFFVAVGVLLLLGVSTLYLTHKQKQETATGAPAPAARPDATPRLVPADNDQTTKTPLLYYSELNEADETISVFSVNYDGSEITLLETLPDLDIKSVQLLEDNQIIYLGDLDGFGRSSTIFTIRDGREIVLIRAPDGYVFDQIYPSPDTSQLVVWEVEDTFYLKESISRIVLYKGLDTEQPRRQVLVEQNGATGQVYYPIFWNTESTALYADTMSTIGKGLYHGIVRINAQTGDVTPVLEAGSYSALPVLSPTGTHLAYPSYDITLPRVNDSTPTTLSPVYILNPNAIGIYSIATDSATQTTPLNNRSYSDITWSPDASQLAFKAYSSDNNTNTLGIIDTESLRLVDQQDTQGGIFAWEQADIIALGTELAGFFGTGIFSGHPTPVRGVYLYNLKTGMYEKVYSDMPIQRISN